MSEDERIALFVDFENLAIGARDRYQRLDMGVMMDALSERGRVIVRRAYADWNLFSDYRENLLSHRIEMIEVPQRTGMVRKNAADVKLAVDAIELSWQRDFITVFVVASGDSDFTPLVLKLRELNKRVIGVGVEGSTSDLLPGACDEFLFYGRLLGQGTSDGPPRRRGRRRNGEESDDDVSDIAALSRLVTQTLSGLQRSIDGPVLSSMIKRAILRKDPTFSEGDYGFRAWGELMRNLEKRRIVSLEAGSARGDPVVDFPSDGGGDREAFELLATVVSALEGRGGPPPLSGLKNELRKQRPGFSEKDLGYGGFLQFVKAAGAQGFVEASWSDEADDYLVSARPGITAARS